jgi:asparagine synthase (glutamine-hydrolysing)
MEILPLLVRHYGEPYADSSAIPTYYVAQMSRRDVTVALNGDGGDESFAGYERYRANYLAALIQSVPGSRLAASALRSFLPDSVDPKNRARRLRRFLTYANEPQPVRYGHWCGLFDSADKERLYTRAFSQELPSGAAERWMASLFAEANGVDPAEAAMSVDINSYLPYDLLVKVDIASMANSLEVRSPFLDHEVMELAATFPARMKLRVSGQKRLLKRAFPDLLPPANVNRPKMGFGLPVGEWLRGPLRDLLRDALLDPNSLAQSHFRPDELTRLMNDHLAARDDHTAQLWALLMLEEWHREMLATH